MKSFFLFFLLMLFFTSCEKLGDSTNINTGFLCTDTASLSPFTSEVLQSVFFLNNSIGFVGGSKGGIYKTSDGGESWTNEASGVSLPIYKITFVNAQTGFATGGVRECFEPGCTPEGGFILKTTDGGSTWNKVYTPKEKLEVRSLFFTNENTGFAISGTTILKTTDAGSTWSEYKIANLPTTMMDIQFANATQGYIACLADILITTKDGGNTWQVQHPKNNDIAGYYSLSVVNGAVYVSGQTEIIKSTDGGNSWDILTSSPADIYAVYFINATTGFALGRGNYSGGDFGYSYGSLYCTSDGGNTWQGTSNIKQPGRLGAVSFPSDSIGYTIGRNQVIRLSVR